MKVFVCKACSCQLELLLQERCMFDIFCSNIHCFHYLFPGFGITLLNGNFAERWRWIEDWRLKIEGLGKTYSIHNFRIEGQRKLVQSICPLKLNSGSKKFFSRPSIFNLKSSIRDKRPKNLRTSDLLKSFAGILDYGLSS